MNNNNYDLDILVNHFRLKNNPNLLLTLYFILLSEFLIIED